MPWFILRPFIFSRVVSMQDSALCFLFTDLPIETNPTLLRSYLSVFGEIGSLDFDAAKRSALVVFSSSVRIDRISTVQHRFMGMPICAARVSPPSTSSPVPSSPSENDSPKSFSPNFRYHRTSCVMRCPLARISPALSPSPLRSSIHSSYDDLPELVQYVPPLQSTQLIAAEIQSIDPPSSPAAPASSSATSCAGSVASATVGANQHAASPIINIQLTEQSNSWAQVAHHLASGKWPAPQVLPLIVWCLTLVVLAC